MDIVHHDSVGSTCGSPFGILFKTTSGSSLGLEGEDAYCNSSSDTPTTASGFNLGLGTLSIKGFFLSDYFFWSEISEVNGTDLTVNNHKESVHHIDIIYDPDRIKLLGTQSQTTNNAWAGVVNEVRVFFR